MATLLAVRDGLTILLKYSNGDDEGDISTEHDILYAGTEDGPPPSSITIEDAAILARLCWHWSETYGCWRHYT